MNDDVIVQADGLRVELVERGFHGWAEKIENLITLAKQNQRESEAWKRLDQVMGSRHTGPGTFSVAIVSEVRVVDVWKQCQIHAAGKDGPT